MIKKKDRVIRRNKKPRRKKVPQKSLRQWFFIFFTIVFFCTLFYIFFLSPLVNIDNVEIRGMQRVHQDELSAIVDEGLAGERFWYIKNSNYFFVNKKDISDNMKNDQRIKTVDVAKKFPNQLFFDISEYNVVSIWCVGGIDNKCFELNDNGCAAREIDMNSSLVTDNKHFVVVDHGHESIDVDQCIVSAEDLKKIQFFGEELIYSLNVGIKQPYTIDFRGSREIKFDTDENWHILVNLDHNKEEVLHVANLFAKKVELPGSRIDLEYVDLRFPEKMFYKMKDGVEQEEKNEDMEKEDDKNEESDVEENDN